MMPGGVPFAVDRFRCTAPARRCDGSYPCCPTALHPLRHVRSASALYRTRSTCQRAPPAASDGLQGYLRPPIDIAAGLIRAALPPCSYQGASGALPPCTALDRHRRGSYPPGIARRRRAALPPFAYLGASNVLTHCAVPDRRIRGHCPPAGVLLCRLVVTKARPPSFCLAPPSIGVAAGLTRRALPAAGVLL